MTPGETRTRLRNSTLFWILYLGVILLCILVNTNVLCLADPKFDHGCGGGDVYSIAFAVWLAPLGILGLLLSRPKTLAVRPRRFFRAGLLLMTALLVEFDWLVIPSVNNPVWTYVVGLAWIFTTLYIVRTAFDSGHSEP
jgi:hypothetical protein